MKNKLLSDEKRIKKIIIITMVSIAMLWLIFTIILDYIPSIGRNICFEFLGHSYGCIPVVKQRNREYESGEEVILKREFYIENESDVRFYIKENKEYIENPTVIFVGNKEIDLYIEYKNKKTKQKKTLKMIDTTSPIIEQIDIPRVGQNEKINIEDYINIYDNSGEDKTTLLNNYTISTKKLGEQEVTITAEDLSKNVTTFEFKYNVLVYPTDFTFKYTPEIELNKSNEISKLSFTPKETTAKNLKYYNYDENILDISNEGKIKAIGLGTTQVYVESENNIIKVMEITVYKKANYNAFCNTGTLSNGKCYSTTTIPANIVYDCYDDRYSYREEYGKCLFAGSHIRTKCPTGYSHSAVYGGCYPIQEAYQSYSCSQGQLSGNVCIITRAYEANKDYYCDTDEELKDGKCYKATYN